MTENENLRDVDNKDQNLDPPKLILWSLAILGAALLLFVGLYFAFGSYIEGIGRYLKETLGLWGVGLVCFFIDAFPTPFSSDFIFAFSKSFQAWELLTMMSLASIAGGCAGYWIARFLGSASFLQKLNRSLRKKGQALITRYGFWALVAAALTPIPYAHTCWVAGILRYPFSHVFFASLFRIPRMVIYYLIISGGLALISAPTAGQ